MTEQASTPAATTMRRWLVVGDIGGAAQFHVGDEAMFAANLQLLQRLCPQAQRIAVSRDPAFTAATYGIAAVPRLGFADCADEAEREVLLAQLCAASHAHWTQRRPAAMEALRNAQDGLLISGGGNLRSTWPAFLYERLALARHAQRLGAPVVVLGQTLGPELTDRHRAMLAELLAMATWVGVREQPSYQLALALGVDASRLSLQLDDAHGLWQQPIRDGYLPQPFALDRPWMALSFHPLCDLSRNDRLLDSLAQQLEQAARLTGCSPVFIPHARADAAHGAPWSDEDMGRALAARMRHTPMLLLPVMLPEQVAWLTAQAHLVISSRYHPLVFGLAAAKPCLGVWSDQYTRTKLRGALEHHGSAHAACNVQELGEGLLIRRLAALWQGRQAWQAHLAAQGRLLAEDEARRQQALATLLVTGQRLETPIPSIAVGKSTAAVDDTPASAPPLSPDAFHRRSPMLTEADWQQFAQDGYLHLGQVLAPEALEALRQRADALALGEVYNPGVQMQLDTGGAYEELPGAVERFDEGTLRYRKIQGLEHDPLYAKLIEQPVFRTICAGMYGAHAAVSIFRAMVMNKPAGHGTLLPWHQDGGAVWQLDRDPLVTIWVALDDANTSNGCMDAVRGSHRLGLLSTQGSTLTEDAVRAHCPPELTVPLEVKAGHALLMHNWLIHRSGLNTSPTPRRAFTMCCMDARTRNLLTGTHFPVVYGSQVSAPDAYVQQLQADLAAQTERFDNAERYAQDLLATNDERQAMIDEATQYARSLEAELARCQQGGNAAQDVRRASAAVAQMRDEILELNHALKTAYEQGVGDGHEMARLRQQVVDLHASVEALHQSASWRITAPLRHLYELLVLRTKR